MKNEISTVWEDLTSAGDWTACLGRELLAGSCCQDGKNPNLDGSPPPGGGGLGVDPVVRNDGAAINVGGTDMLVSSAGAAGDLTAGYDDDDLKGSNGSRSPSGSPGSHNVNNTGGVGCRGVYFDHIRHLWRANWPEETIVMDRESKRPLEVRRCTRTKGFSAKKFGYLESKRMAVAHRKTMITSGVIRKYIYQDSATVVASGGSAVNSANSKTTTGGNSGASSPIRGAASNASPTSSGKKSVRDKKRRKAEKVCTVGGTVAQSTTTSLMMGAGASAILGGVHCGTKPGVQNGEDLIISNGGGAGLMIGCNIGQTISGIEPGGAVSQSSMLCCSNGGNGDAASTCASTEPTQSPSSRHSQQTSSTALEMLLCLDSSTAQATNGQQIDSTVAYDFTFL